MDIVELSKCEDIFYNILPHINKSLLTLKTVSKYFNTYVNNYINYNLKNKHHTLDLTKYNLHDIHPDTFTIRAKIQFMIKYPKEKDNTLITFLLNNIILNMIRKLNYFESDDWFPPEEDYPKIKQHDMIKNDIKNNHDLLTTIYDKSDGIIKLTYLLKNATILEMAYMKDNELVNYCKTIHTYIKNKEIKEEDYKKITSYLKQLLPTPIWNAFASGIYSNIKIIYPPNFNFAHIPENYQPSGTMNISRVGDFYTPSYINITLPTT